MHVSTSIALAFGREACDTRRDHSLPATSSSKTFANLLSIASSRHETWLWLYGHDDIGLEEYLLRDGHEDREMHANILKCLIAQRFSWVEERQSTRLMWHDCIGTGETEQS